MRRGGQSIEDIHKIAQGRVWSGTEAREIGLVDKLGGLDKAIESAATLAGLEEDTYKAEFIKQAMPLSDQMIDTILNSSISQKLLEDFSIFQIYSENQIINKLKDLQELNDPSGIYALSTIMFE